MVNHRRRLPRTPKPSSIFLRARLYSAAATSPFCVSVHTLCPPPLKPADPSLADPLPPRYPCVEDLLDSYSVQTHVHDVPVRLEHGGAVSRFRIFFKRHQYMPHSGCLDLKGDVVVMRTAFTDDKSVVNLRSSDLRLCDFVVQRILPQLKAFQSPSKTPLPDEFKLTRARR